MKIETIITRVENSKKSVAKIEGTLERHGKRLEKIKTDLTKMGFESFDDYNRYSEEIRKHDKLFMALYDYENKLEDIKSNQKKLTEARANLAKYERMLEEEMKKDAQVDSIIPECLVQYLNQWKEDVKKYLITVCNDYLNLKSKIYAITEEELKNLTQRKYIYGQRRYETVPVYTEEEINEILEGKYESDVRMAHSKIRMKYINLWKSRITSSTLTLVEKAIYRGEIDESILDSFLDEEVKVKKEIFVNRIQDITGKIIDMVGFNIGDNGEINGTAKGEKADAKVTTIIAGGYNIQRQHFRVLVREL